MIKLIIFDLDGTLVDTLADLTDATNHMLGQCRRPSLSPDEVRKLVGQGARKLVERALPGAPEEEIERALGIFLAYNNEHIADKTRLYDGVEVALAALRHRGMRMAVISNKNVALCRKLLETLGADTYFALILGADSLPNRKPSPEPVLKVLNDLDTAASDTVIVGDSINDITAGKGASVATVGCSYGYGGAEEIAQADYRIDRFQELLALPLFTT